MKAIIRNLYLLPLLYLFISCGGNGKSGSIKVDGMQSKVQKVLDGNKIELKNGLKVEILGIRPTEDTKNYLEKHVKNENVIIIADSKQKQFIKSYKTKVKAYVKLKGDKYCISGKLLLNGTAELRQTAVHDSLEHFKAYPNIGGERPPMSQTELLTYMKPATFMVYCQNEGLGTGFFINDNGLALTNNHVYDGSQNAVICFFGDDGKLDATNYRKINRVLYTVRTGEKERIDFTVFQVQLDNGEKVRYMPLIKQHARDGEKIAKIGCPLGTSLCDFQPGTLSHYNEGYFTHNIPTNHGDSGGPIVNFKGEVIGVNQSIDFNDVIREQAKGIAYGVDAVLIRQVLDENNIQYGR